MADKIIATVLVIIALLLLIIAASILGSAPASLLVIVALVAALGAIALLLYALKLYLRNPKHNKGHRHQFTPGQRLGMLAVGVMMLLFGVRDLVNGNSDPVRGSLITREQQPSEYWQSVLIYLSAGTVLVFVGVRKPPS